MIHKVYKSLFSTYIMPKKDLKETKIEKNKAETTIVKGTVTTQQQEVINNLVGVIGSNEQDVVGKILTIWLYNEGYLKENNKN
jgi:hypothetical protein